MMVNGDDDAVKSHSCVGFQKAARSETGRDIYLAESLNKGSGK